MKSYKSAIALSTLVCAVSAIEAAAVEVDVSGFIRQEAAYKLNDDKNIFNQHGNRYNGKTVVNSLGSNITRSIDSKDNDWNLMATRVELDFQISISDNWKGFVKARGYFDNNVYSDYGDPNFFEVPLRGDCGTALEVCGDNYMVDLPSAYLDYNNGPLWLRLGNQQIAWGEAIFFRVADVANGLDLRRHGVLDWAAEEFADERVPGLGVRGSYRFRNDWEFEFFVQQFNASIYGNENTPYNVIPRQFVVHQEEGFDKVDDAWNTGLRLQGQLGELGLQFFAVSRRNPDGVFRWTESEVNPFAGTGVPALEGLGALLAQTPFEISELGVYTGEEWYNYAAATRLNGTTGLNAAINEFAASQALGAFEINTDPAGACVGAFGITDTQTCGALELDVFFDAGAGGALGGGLGPLRGHIAREYPYENVFGFGTNYVFFGEPDTLLDQLVVRFEATITPDKKFTNPSLSRDYIEEDEWAASLVFEKYHRFSSSFPATFMVAQYMFRSEADLYGRHLSGNDNTGEPKGDENFHAVAFALQQPFPNLIWRVDLAVLYDLKGGLLVQPGIRWKPDSHLSVELYANILDSDGGNDDIIETVEWADELGLRVGYQF
jgi:Protein of unknown function (DUF1302)